MKKHKLKHYDLGNSILHNLADVANDLSREFRESHPSWSSYLECVWENLRDAGQLLEGADPKENEKEIFDKFVLKNLKQREFAEGYVKGRSISVDRDSNSSDDKIVILVDEFIQETDKAYKVRVGFVEDWLPKSQVEVKGKEIIIPKWLFDKKKFKNHGFDIEEI